MEPKRLCRASVDKKICGVCGGIAHYFDVDSNLIRLITAALVLAGGLSVWLYIIAAIILPETDAFFQFVDHHKMALAEQFDDDQPCRIGA